jgi:hypothetical protein
MIIQRFDSMLKKLRFFPSKGYPNYPAMAHVPNKLIELRQTRD